MPHKVPLVRIGVQRDGVTMYPDVGKVFDFTAAELSDLDKMTEKAKKAALTDPAVAIPEYYRDPVNEDKPADLTDAERDARDRASGRQTAGARITLDDGTEVSLASGQKMTMGDGRKVTLGATNEAALGNGNKITVANGAEVTLSDGRTGTFSYTNARASTL